MVSELGRGCLKTSVPTKVEDADADGLEARGCRGGGGLVGSAQAKLQTEREGERASISGGGGNGKRRIA